MGIGLPTPASPPAVPAGRVGPFVSAHTQGTRGGPRVAPPMFRFPTNCRRKPLKETPLLCGRSDLGTDQTRGNNSPYTTWERIPQRFSELNCRELERPLEGASRGR